METIYRAFDGTEFDDEFDCMDYELKKKFHAEQVALCIFADESGKRMKTPPVYGNFTTLTGLVGFGLSPKRLLTLSSSSATSFLSLPRAKSSPTMIFILVCTILIK